MLMQQDATNMQLVRNYVSSLPGGSTAPAPAPLEPIRASTDGEGNNYYGKHDDSGKKDGDGVLKLKDGTSYQGPFVNDERHGIGTVTRANGTCFRAEYRNGELVRELDAEEDGDEDELSVMQVKSTVDAVGDKFKLAETNGDVIEILDD